MGGVSLHRHIEETSSMAGNRTDFWFSMQRVRYFSNSKALGSVSAEEGISYFLPLSEESQGNDANDVRGDGKRRLSGRESCAGVCTSVDAGGCVGIMGMKPVILVVDPTFLAVEDARALKGGAAPPGPPAEVDNGL